MSQDKPVSAQRTEAEREQRAGTFFLEQWSSVTTEDMWNGLDMSTFAAAFATQEVSQAVAAEREACAKAMCAMCRNGKAIMQTGSSWIHLDLFNGNKEICRAAAIHSRTDKGGK